MVDYPNSKKARKVFLCLMVGSGRYPNARLETNPGEAMDVDQRADALPQGLDGEEREDTRENAVFERRRMRESGNRKGKNRKGKGGVDKAWILKKKEVRFICRWSSPILSPSPQFTLV